MKKHIERRQISRLLAASAAVVGLAGVQVTPANASLVLDVQAVAYNGGALPAGSGPKLVAGVHAGDIISLKIYGRIVDGSVGSANDCMQSGQGSLLSSTGGLLGNLLNGALTPPFTGVSSGVGSSNDYDSDGDLDLGGAPSKNIVPTSVQWTFRSGSPTAIGATGEIEIASADFVVGNNFGQTQVNWSIRKTSSGGNMNTSGLWWENGVQKNPTIATLASGAAVVIHTPEPAGLAMLGIAGLGLLARRRDA